MFIVLYQQDGIQNILLKLTLMIDASCRSHEQRRLLAAYVLFVHQMLPEFGTSLKGQQGFLLRDVIHTSLRTMSSVMKKCVGQDDGLKLLLLCDLLNDVCNAAITTCVEVGNVELTYRFL